LITPPGVSTTVKIGSGWCRVKEKKYVEYLRGRGIAGTLGLLQRQSSLHLIFCTLDNQQA